MKIGLVDVGGHAKKKKFGATVYPNLALCKIARYHKEKGDEVEWVDGKPVCVKTEQVDGERIKADTWYKIENGEFVEC